MAAFEIFALTTRGLEAVSAAEMARIPGVNITETAYRRVAATCEESPDALLHLRTVDDLYLHLATWQDVRHTRDVLGLMQTWSGEHGLSGAVKI
jgi:hypothetical protein